MIEDLVVVSVGECVICLWMGLQGMMCDFLSVS